MNTSVKSFIGTFLALILTGSGFYLWSSFKEKKAQENVEQVKLSIEQMKVNAHYSQRTPEVSIEELAVPGSKPAYMVSLSPLVFDEFDHNPLRHQPQFELSLLSAQDHFGSLLAVRSVRPLDIVSGQKYRVIADGKVLDRVCDDFQLLENDLIIFEKTVHLYTYTCANNGNTGSIEALENAKSIKVEMTLGNQVCAGELNASGRDKVQEFFKLIKSHK